MTQKQQIEAFFATAKTPNAILPTDVEVDVQPSGFVSVNGKVTVPEGVPGLPANEYHITWNGNGRALVFSPRVTNPEAATLLSVYKPAV